MNKEPKIGTFEESTEDTRRILRQLMAEAKTEQERLNWALRLAMDPGWNDWLKNEGATTTQIIESLTDVCAQLICETANNCAKENMEAQMAGIIAKNILSRVLKLMILGESLGGQMIGYSRGHS